jgi:hypothetical protein
MASRSSSSSPARRARRRSGPDRESIRPRAAHHRARQAHARWRPPGPSTHDTLRWIPPFPPVESATKAVQKRLPSTSQQQQQQQRHPPRGPRAASRPVLISITLSCFIQRTPFFLLQSSGSVLPERARHAGVPGCCALVSTARVCFCVPIGHTISIDRSFGITSADSNPQFDSASLLSLPESSTHPNNKRQHTHT